MYDYIKHKYKLPKLLKILFYNIPTGSTPKPKWKFVTGELNTSLNHASHNKKKEQSRAEPIYWKNPIREGRYLSGC